MGGCNQSNVSANRLVSSNSLESLLLEQAQDLRLKRDGHVADFVQQNRAAAELLELSNATAIGSAEGAFLMTKQFTFQKILRDGGAVRREKGRWSGSCVDG